MIALSRRRLVLGALAFCLAGGAAADYPDKQFTFIVPFAAGSATDQLARALGQEVTRITKQPAIVDDRPGASGFIGAELAKKPPPTATRCSSQPIPRMRPTSTCSRRFPMTR